MELQYIKNLILMEYKEIHIATIEVATLALLDSVWTIESTVWFDFITGLSHR